MAEHRQHEHHQRRRQGPPEATAEITQFGIVLVVQPRHFRLQCHAADGANAGTFLAYLRMHGADVHRSRRCLRGGAIGLPGQIFGRISHEALPAARRTKVACHSLMLGVVSRLIGVDWHAADRIKHGCRRAGMGAVSVFVGARVVMASVHVASHDWQWIDFVRCAITCTRRGGTYAA